MLIAYNNMVDMWYDPRDIAQNEKEFECEMTRDDHGFLCGLLKEKRPDTILEIGVAEGGTTFVVDSAMRLIEKKGKLVSVDISPTLYCDKSKDTGWIYTEKNGKKWLDHSFIFGHTVADAIKNINEKIDFVIIDTTHMLPGELLDFLVVLPYLKNGSTVVLHDVMLNVSRGLCKNPSYVASGVWSNATKLLFSSVSGIKYCPNIKLGKSHCNISAFDVNDDTKENIYDVFFALTNTWRYIPSKLQISEYRTVIRREYDQKCNDIFEYSLEMNKKIDENVDFYEKKGFHIPYEQIPYGAKVIIYGAGVVGKLLHDEILQSKYCSIVLWVDKDFKKHGNPICNPNMILDAEFDYIIVAVEKKMFSNRFTNKLSV